MDKETFMSKLETEAQNYAFETVMDPEEHLDAIEAIKFDFIEGGKKAYCILNNCTWD